jgi:hypothetical protein
MAKKPVSRSPDLQTPNATHQAIGKFVASFSQLEASLRWIVIAELGIAHDKGKEAVISFINYSSLCKVAQSLLLLIEPSKRPTDTVIKNVIERCSEMGSKRNIVAHASWGEKGAEHIRRRTMTPEFSFQNPGELDALSEKVSKLTLEVLYLYAAYWPDTVQGRSD